MSKHWLDTVDDIFRSNTSDLRKLAHIAGADPATFYRGANLAGADLRGQDLRGLDLTNADLSDAIIDESTKIDLEFEPLDRGLEIFKTAELAPYVYKSLIEIAEAFSLRHRTRALRFLVRLTMIRIKNGYEDIHEWRQMLLTDTQLRHNFSVGRRQRKNMTLKISRRDHNFVIDLGWRFRGRSAGYNAAGLIGLLILQGRFPSTAPSFGLQHIEYDHYSRKLIVQFRSGNSYEYMDIPPKLYEKLISSRNPIQYFNGQIKYRFRSENLTPEQPSLF